MRVGVDLDGTVYQWDEMARYLLRRHRGYAEDGPLGMESDDWHYIQGHIRPEDWEWLWSEGLGHGLFRTGHVYPGAIPALKEIAGFAEVVVITKRPEAARMDTLWFVVKRLPFVSRWHLLADGESKSQVACDLYIDDAPQIVGDLAANTSARIALMDRPWNAAVRYAGDTWDQRIVRIGSWAEAVGLARHIKEGK